MAGVEGGRVVERVEEAQVSKVPRVSRRLAHLPSVTKLQGLTVIKVLEL